MLAQRHGAGPRGALRRQKRDRPRVAIALVRKQQCNRSDRRMFGQKLLGARQLWRDRGTRTEWIRQRLKVDLAVLGQRQPRQFHEPARHHVVGQDRSDTRAQLLRARLLAVTQGIERDQMRIAALLLAHRDDALANLGKPRQRQLHLAELDTKAAHFDLEVVAANVLKAAVAPQPHQVPGAVHRTRTAERIRHETFMRQVVVPQITAADARASNPKFADRAARHPGLEGVEYIGLRVADRTADGDRIRGYPVDARPNGGLGGTVGVPQHANPWQQVFGELLRQRLAATDRGQASLAVPACKQQHAPHRRRRL